VTLLAAAFGKFFALPGGNESLGSQSAGLFSGFHQEHASCQRADCVAAVLLETKLFRIGRQDATEQWSQLFAGSAQRDAGPAAEQLAIDEQILSLP
jgi:hypothetical protein